MRKIEHILLSSLLVFLAVSATAQPPFVLDLADVTTRETIAERVHGSSGTGVFGVPVAAGPDMDGDGLVDLGVAYMTASVDGVSLAGEVDLVFGKGRIGGTFDTAMPNPRFLRILGDGRNETTGNEIWMDDVTGDGLGDLLICRQNFSLEGRVGAGALTVVPGSPDLRTRALALEPLDLAAPDAPAFTIVGRQALGRFCIWVRTGDVDGDGVADLVVGADQEGTSEETHRGAAYVIRGGSHLAGPGRVDLIDPNALTGGLTRITPPPGSGEFHFGATCQATDLDGDGRAEVLAAAALNRAGASLRPDGGPSPHGRGGSPEGTVYAVWGETWAGAWPAEIAVDQAPPETVTVIDGGSENRIFGEDLAPAGDFDGDGRADLLITDFLADVPGRPLAGDGWVFFDAARLRGRVLDLDAIPADLVTTRILGVESGSLAGDTAATGDVNRDGLDDVFFGAPHASPQGRELAGTVHLLLGRSGGWPDVVDTAPGQLPPDGQIRILEVQGARGQSTENGQGDILAYSALLADVDGDRAADLVINEMTGDGLGPGTLDVGNLLVIRATALPGFGPWRVGARPLR